MYITWEDRKNIGKINNNTIYEKPTFSFEYAWILLTDNTAQYVESHEPDVFNKDMSIEQITEVTEFYNAYKEPVYIPTFAEIKNIKIEEIKYKREQSSLEPINNVQVATLQDRENIQGSIEYFAMLSQGKGTITWTMADNTEQDLSLQELQNVLDTYVLRKAQAFSEYQNKKQLIDNCVTVEELEALGI